MCRRLLLPWACLVLVGAVGADTTFSYAVTGDTQSAGDNEVSVTFTPGASAEGVPVPPTGTDILAGHYTYETFHLPHSGAAPWTGQIRLTDAASGETRTAAIGGTMYANPFSGKVTLDPATLTVGRNRYTLTTGPFQQEGMKGRTFTIHVMVQNLDAPYLAFTTQPGPRPAYEPLRPQPVVAVLNPDGSVATGYSGVVALSLRRGTAPSTAVITGQRLASIENGVAAFTSAGVSEPAEGCILTATTEGASGVDSAPFKVIMPLGPNPVVSYRTTGREFHAYDPAWVSHGYLSVGTGYSGSAAATPTGTAVSPFVLFEYRVGGETRYGFGGVWHIGLELIDETTGETASKALAGSFELAGVAASYGDNPLTASLFPRTIVAGGRRYTITSLGPGAAPPISSFMSSLGGVVTYNPPEQPGLAFATQPGGRAGTLSLDPQPVVVMRNPDGTTDTSFNGPVTLIVTPGTADAALSRFDYGQVTCDADGGVAVFTGLSLTRSAGYVTLTAFSGANPGADSQPFGVGKGAAFTNAIRALRIAGGLDAAGPVDGAPTMETAVSLLRQASGLN